MKKLFCVIAAIAASGCATNPDKISAAYVSPLKYQNYTCAQISQEMDYVGKRTTTLYHQLKKDSKADKWQMGIGLVLFWPVLFALEGGDGPEASEFSQLKGEFEALRQTAVKQNCAIEAKSPEQIIKEAEEEAKAARKKD
jgi:hypothetical protein